MLPKLIQADQVGYMKNRYIGENIRIIEDIMKTSFLKWIEILYNKIESCVSNNGYFSKYFELSRGIRQGCPISALLFILVAEVMAIKIRNNEKVCGIKFRNIEYKICQLADDTTIFVKDTDSIIQLLSVMKKFQNCSGLKINVEKTEIIPVGI